MLHLPNLLLQICKLILYQPIIIFRAHVFDVLTERGIENGAEIFLKLQIVVTVI